MKNGLSIAFLAACLLLQSCGFHLRGSEQAQLTIPLTYLQGGDAAAGGVRPELLNSAVFGQFTENNTGARYALTIISETIERRVLSVAGSTGKVREYALLYNITFQLKDLAGNDLTPAQTLGLSRDYRFNADQVLGNEREEALLRRDMAREAARQIALRIQAQVTP